MPAVADVSGRLFAGLPPIFRDCVAGFAGKKFDLRTPFVAGPHVYASNYVVLVRVPVADVPGSTLKLLPTGRRKKLPKQPWEEVESRGPFAKRPIALPDLGSPWEPCILCSGSGTASGVCCPDCEGDGRLPIEFERVTLGKRFEFSRFYLSLLRLHGVVCYPPARPKASDTCLYFRAATGNTEGLLMGLNPERKRNKPTLESRP